MLKQAESTIPIGTVIDGKYRVDGVVGRGGMGTVYRAQHLALHEPVAIKLLNRDAAADDEIVTRFLREAQWAVKLRSEHVARIHDIGQTEEGLPFMVMELLEGADLGQLVEENGAMYRPIAVDLLLQGCDAIVEAHSLGIVHRDIKPTNLFVSFRPDQTALVKVLDFGISKAAGGTDLSLTQTQSMLGTPAYMSPEQMRSARDVDQRTDIWSLGTVLYELCEARRPFQAESFSEMCVMVAVDPPQPLVNAPELSAVIARCLAKDPAQRYASVAELMADLAPFANNPDAARYYVTRAQRVLGLRDGQGASRASAPNLTDSGPIANVAATAIPIANLTMRGPRAVPAPTLSTVDPAEPTRIDPLPSLRPRRATWLVAIAALLLGIGGAIAYLKLTDNAPNAKPSTTDEVGTTVPANVAATPEDRATGSGDAPGSASDRASGSDVPGQGGSGSAEPERTASGSGALDRVGSGAGSDSGSAVTATVAAKKPPVKKPPVKKPPVKKPPVEVVKPPVEKPPVKKCDPFDSRVKCS